MFHSFVLSVPSFQVVEGNALLIYRFLYDAAHKALEGDASMYSGVQILLVLSEIAQTASYPLCSSVFHLIHYCIDVSYRYLSHR